MVSGHWPALVAEQLLTGVLPPDTERMPTVGFGRKARIADPAAFRAEQPVECNISLCQLAITHRQHLTRLSINDASVVHHTIAGHNVAFRIHNARLNADIVESGEVVPT